MAEVERAAREYLGDDVDEIGRDELIARLRKGDVVLVDVRPAEEYEAGHIDGARSIPIEELEERLAELPADREIVAYCRGPFCAYAHDAVRRLQAAGRAASRLEQGWPEWKLQRTQSKPNAQGGKRHDDTHGSPSQGPGPAMSTIDIPVDVDVFARRSAGPHRGLHRPRASVHLPHPTWVGARARLPRARARTRSRRDRRELRRVANHWTLGRVQPGGSCSTSAVGLGPICCSLRNDRPNREGHRVDMTTAMLERARANAHEMGLENVELHESLIETLPLVNASVDIVISNGVIDLVPDKDAVFDEIDRVLRPGGRLQFADVVIHHKVSEDARKRIDLWTG